MCEFVSFLRVSPWAPKAEAALDVSGQVKISGLESPVFVREADDRHVDLFLNYSTSVTISQ